MHYYTMRFFVCAFLLLFLQCQDGNDVDEYNKYLKESNLDLLQLDALKQMGYMAKSTIEDARNSRYTSRKVDIYAPIYYNLAYVNSRINDSIEQLQSLIQRNSYFTINAYNEPKFFDNKLPHKNKKTYENRINDLIELINKKYFESVESEKDSVGELMRDRYVAELNRIDSFSNYSFSQLVDNSPQVSNTDYLKLVLKLKIINETIYSQYTNYIVNQLGRVRLCQYHSIQHLAIIKNLKALPGSQNEIVIKTDIHEIKTEKLFINSQLQKDFYELDIYRYKFKSPLKPGKYYHNVLFNSIRADGSTATFSKTLKYEVVDSCIN